MNQYQKRIFTGIFYALFSGVIWGICGILGEYFFNHYQVSSGWITSTRLVIAGVCVLLLSARQNGMAIFDIWKDKGNYLPFLAYAILGVFSVQFFFYLCIESSNAATATILQFISPVFILVYNHLMKRQRASKLAVCYIALAMLGVTLMATKGDFSSLAITPFALATGLLSAVAVGFNVILPQRFAKRYGFINTVGWGMLLAGLLSNTLYPVTRLTFSLDWVSVIIILTIALFGTALSFLVSMKAASLVSPLIVSVIGASEPLSSALLSVLFLGLQMDWLLVTAMFLVVVPMVFLSIEESKSGQKIH
ncbi:DMT family transporter [Streptococcus himalayensis]|uniref:Multidrug transporter n=1 Tax=Streptococcus himalayensis TaxID=1888195 RepID=A0A917EF81_9STRE|nr:DMT family transporter [Streptococcus himalayensis]GGE35232.1 multidrug transporter [Streptococcus himalayensis]